MEPFNLEMTLWAYLATIGAVVALSAAVVAGLPRRANGWRPYRRVVLLDPSRGRFIGLPITFGAIGTVSMVLFALVVAVGLFGAQNPYRNMAPLAVWTVAWVGVSAISAMLGNFWALINPWVILFTWAETFHARLWPGRRLSLELRYPARLGAGPAVILFMALVWIGLVWEAGQTPARMALVIAAYSAITWTGMTLFGKETWIQNGEALSLAFSLLARLAPTETARRVEVDAAPTLYLRAPGSGLLTDRPVPWALTVMVLLMLATAVFDGMVDTPAWTGVHDWLLTDRTVWLLVSALLELGLDLPAAMKTWAFALCAAAVIGLYLLVAGIAAWAGGGTSTNDMARSLVLSLVPLVAVIHLAHHLPDMGSATRQVAALAADPFGLGYSLWEVPETWSVTARLDGPVVWYATVAAVLVGHVLAVGTSSAMVSRQCADARSAWRGQLPVAALLVGSAMGSLWILAQPFIQAEALSR